MHLLHTFVYVRSVKNSHITFFNVKILLGLHCISRYITSVYIVAFRRLGIAPPLMKRSEEPKCRPRLKPASDTSAGGPSIIFLLFIAVIIIIIIFHGGLLTHHHCFKHHYHRNPTGRLENQNLWRGKGSDGISPAHWTWIKDHEYGENDNSFMFITRRAMMVMMRRRKTTE